MAKVGVQEEEAPPSVREYLCPECRTPYADPDAFSKHLERHREVGRVEYSVRGKLKTPECSKGCGRPFKKTGGERRSHEALCDGSPPIKQGEIPEAQKRSFTERKETVPPDYTCDLCDKECGGGAGLAAHKRSKHGVKRSRKKPGRRSRVERPSKPGDQGEDMSELVKLLKERAEEFRRRADRIDEIAEEISSLL